MHLSMQHKRDYTPRNLYYKKDIAYVTKHSKWILQSIGIWPAVVGNVTKFLPKIAIALSNFVLLFAIIPCILHIIFEEKDTIMRLKLSGLLSFCCTSLMKYWALTLRKPRIKDCIEQVWIDWEQVSELTRSSILIDFH